MSAQVEETIKLMADQVVKLVSIVEGLADRLDRAERSLRSMGIVLDQHELDIQKIRRGEA